MTRSTFRERAAKATADARLVKAIAKTAGLLLEKRRAAVAALPDFEEKRRAAREAKAEVVENLDLFAGKFADRARAKGAIVHFADGAEDVAKVVSDLASRLNLKTAVKAKSMTAEEIGLNELSGGCGIETTETDLGEFIIQLAGEKPSHIMAPAIHRDRAQVAELFAEKIGARPDLGVAELVAAARAWLRARFLSADLGISGCNFAVAETGTVVLVTNEGNGRMATALPRVHLVVMGIEKVVPTLADVPGMLALLTRSASGQPISTYVNFITGPRRGGDSEGPEELHIVILDHGRKRIAAGPCKEMLYCLHCGACLNHCPVYRAVGGHAWESAYPGPMGSVLSPLIFGLSRYPDLPDACTLCGRCREACPMAIPLPEYHLALRAKRSGGGGSRVARAVLGSPKTYRLGLAVLRRLLASGVNPPPVGYAAAWLSARAAPKPKPGPTFREWWEKRK